MDWNAGIPDELWDEALFAAGGHFLQSSHWAAFQVSLGRKTFFMHGKDWQCLAIVEPSRASTRLYCPYGPTATSEVGMARALHELQLLAKQQAAVFVRMEPVGPATSGQLREYGLKPALKDIQPHLSWTQDLTKPVSLLMSELTATNRNLYNNFATKGLVLKASHVPRDMSLFIELMRGVAAHNGILQHPDVYYQKMAETLLPRQASTLYIAEHQGKAVATAFCFDSPTTRYYAHAAADFEARKLHPGTPLLVQMMLDAKQRGQSSFDFVGVAPKDAPKSHRWAGFTAFKQSFGGDYKQYMGTWEMPVNKLVYGLYRGAYKLRKALR